MKSITYQIFLIAFILQLGFAKAQPDEQPGLHSEGGPLKFYSYFHERLSNADDIKSAVINTQKPFTEGSNLRCKNPNDECQFKKEKTDGINQKVKPSNYLNKQKAGMQKNILITELSIWSSMGTAFLKVILKHLKYKP